MVHFQVQRVAKQCDIKPGVDHRRLRLRIREHIQGVSAFAQIHINATTRQHVNKVIK